MKKNNFINKMLNVSLLLFTAIFIIGLYFVIKTFKAYSSLEGINLSFLENILVITFAISILCIPAIIIAKIIIHNKEKKIKSK